MVIILGLIANLLPEKGKARYLINQVEIASFIEGRLRVIYPQLKQDHSLQDQIAQELSQIKEVQSFKINCLTGSVLIMYNAQQAANNKFLNELLTLAAQKIKGGK